MTNTHTKRLFSFCKQTLIRGEMLQVYPHEKLQKKFQLGLFAHPGHWSCVLFAKQLGEIYLRSRSLRYFLNPLYYNLGTYLGSWLSTSSKATLVTLLAL